MSMKMKHILMTMVQAPNVQENIVAVQSPSKPTKESILQDSPIRVTRRLGILSKYQFIAVVLM